MDQNQTVQEQPGAEPEQSEHQGPPTGPQPEAEPPEQAEPAAAAPPSTRHQASRQHGGDGGPGTTSEPFDEGRSCRF